MWLIFTHWLLLTWVIICCLFQSWQSRQSLYLHRKWNYQKYCVSTSIGKLNILETCIFFFFSHLNKLNHSNARPSTASISIITKLHSRENLKPKIWHIVDTDRGKKKKKKEKIENSVLGATWIYILLSSYNSWAQGSNLSLLLLPGPLSYHVYTYIC